MAQKHPTVERTSKIAVVSRMTAGELITNMTDLQALAREWDALAIAASKPVTGPAWALAWWHHVASEGLRPRIVAVRHRAKLIGIAAFHVAGVRYGLVEYRLMGSAFGMSMEPLALPGREWDVAAETARVLDSCRPRPDVLAFGPMPLASHWAIALSLSWPGPMRAVVRQYRVLGEPVVLLPAPTLDTWHASLSAKTQRTLRREERMFEAAGGTSRWTTAATLRADVEAFARLHRARWEGGGQSRLAALGPRFPDWLEDLGRYLVADGRFRMCMLEAGGKPICGNLHLISGEECAGVNVGWDPRYAKLAPGKLAMVREIEDACRHGCRRVSLGYGNDPYKLIFANGNDPVAWTWVMRPSTRLPRAYFRALPHILRGRARDLARRWLPAERFDDALSGAYRRLRH